MHFHRKQANFAIDLQTYDREQQHRIVQGRRIDKLTRKLTQAYDKMKAPYEPMVDIDAKLAHLTSLERKMQVFYDAAR